VPPRNLACRNLRVCDGRLYGTAAVTCRNAKGDQKTAEYPSLPGTIQPIENVNARLEANIHRSERLWNRQSNSLKPNPTQASLHFTTVVA
jgi:hypothetical protein